MRDLIDRQAAIDAVLDMNAEHRVSWMDAVIDIIEELPTIRTRRSTIWIREWQGTCCGICGGHPLALSLVDEIGPEVLSEYCPHCGAHMENWEE